MAVLKPFRWFGTMSMVGSGRKKTWFGSVVGLTGTMVRLGEILVVETMVFLLKQWLILNQGWSVKLCFLLLLLLLW